MDHHTTGPLAAVRIEERTAIPIENGARVLMVNTDQKISASWDDVMRQFAQGLLDIGPTIARTILRPLPAFSIAAAAFEGRRIVPGCRCRVSS